MSKSEPIIRPVYRMRDLPLRIGLSKPAVYRFIKEGAFPPGRRIDTNVRIWTEEEISGWLEERFAMFSQKEGEAA